MRTSTNGFNFLRFRETSNGKPLLRAYQNKNDKPTIGYGLTTYPNGTPVKLGDVYASETQANNDFLEWIRINVETPLNTTITRNNVTLNQNQFDALVSFSFNRSVYTLEKTALWAIIKRNPNDSRITTEFVNAWGTNVTYKDSLIARRKLEAKLYTGGTPPIDNGSNLWVYFVGLLVLIFLFRNQILKLLNL